MDLLYENELYDHVLQVMDCFLEKQPNLLADKYPYACATIALAACHKQVGGIHGSRLTTF